jgi:hypothetical protein
VNQAPLFEQIPPFLHGDESQGFGFGSRNRQKYNLVDYLLSLVFLICIFFLYEAYFSMKFARAL